MAAHARDPPLEMRQPIVVTLAFLDPSRRNLNFYFCTCSRSFRAPRAADNSGHVQIVKVAGACQAVATGGEARSPVPPPSLNESGFESKTNAGWRCTGWASPLRSLTNESAHFVSSLVPPKVDKVKICTRSLTKVRAYRPRYYLSCTNARCTTSIRLSFSVALPPEPAVKTALRTPG
jgi:hypothetical protein